MSWNESKKQYEHIMQKGNLATTLYILIFYKKENEDEINYKKRYALYKERLESQNLSIEAVRDMLLGYTTVDIGKLIFINNTIHGRVQKNLFK